MPPYERLPMDGFARYRNFNLDTDIHKLEIPGELPRRPGKFNSVGKPIAVMLNTFNVDKYPTQLVYQYDVSHACSIPIVLD
jgi:hypothetical protein